MRLTFPQHQRCLLLLEHEVVKVQPIYLVRPLTKVLQDHRYSFENKKENDSFLRKPAKFENVKITAFPRLKNPQYRCFEGFFLRVKLNL